MKKLSVSKIAHFTGHRDAIFSLCSPGRADRVISGAADGMVVEWDTLNPDKGKLLVNVPAPVYSLLHDAENGRLLIGTRSGNLHVVSPDEGREMKNILAHQAGIFDIRLNGRELITAGGDGVVKVWDRVTLDLLAVIDRSSKSARVLALHPSSQVLAVGYSDHMIRLYDLTTREETRKLEGHTNSVFALAFDRKGGRLLSGGRDAVLRAWDTGEYKLKKEIPAHYYHINHISFNGAGDLFSTCSLDKTIKLWDAGSLELLKVIDFERYASHTSSVNKVIWLDDKSFVSCSDDRSLALFSVNVD